MSNFGRVVGFAWLLTLGIAHATPPQPLSKVVALDPNIGELPESIAADCEGNLYVSTAVSVEKIAPNGAVSVLATLPVPANQAFTTGVKLAPDGRLVVGTASFDPTLGAAGVWKVSRSTGAFELVTPLDPSGFPNDFAFDDAGNIFVTEPFLGRIYKIGPNGSPSVWISDPALVGDPIAPALPIHDFGVDGIAFGKNKQHLYVTNLDKGQILRIPVRANGSAGPIEVFASDPLLKGADGIAFDKQWTLYVAVGASDRIATVDKSGHVSVFAQGGLLDGPSAFVFGTRPSDKKTLYITNFAIVRVLQGLSAQPGVLKVSVPHAGLPLP